jgi:hypothetical protein
MDETGQFLEAFREHTREALRFCCLVRADEFQQAQQEHLGDLEQEAHRLKENAVGRRDEGSANQLLSAELILRALTHELQMWVALKERRYAEAWDLLISAQDATQAALQAYPDLDGVDYHVQRLHAIEKVVFPEMMFMSTGYVIDSIECSICGEELGECDHIKGRPYMGRLCHGIVRKIKRIREVSIVHEPADKRCRIFSFSENGVKRDLLTWQVLSEPLDTQNSTK